MVNVSPALSTGYYVIEEILTDEEREIRYTPRAFCEKEAF